MYRRAVRRPSRIAVIGLWLLSVPGILTVASGVILGSASSLVVIDWLPFVFLSVFIAVKATRRLLAMDPGTSSGGAAQGNA
jgi:hypothetical protein